MTCVSTVVIFKHGSKLGHFVMQYFDSEDTIDPPDQDDHESVILRGGPVQRRTTLPLYRMKKSKG